MVLLVTVPFEGEGLLKGSIGLCHNIMHIGTVSKVMLGKFLRQDRVLMGFSDHTDTILN